MSALKLSFPLETLREIFERHGIYLLKAFPDGQTRWGNAPMAQPYKGRSAMAHPYISLGSERRYDIFAIRAIIDRLRKDAERDAIQSELYDRAVGDEDMPFAAVAGAIN